MVDRNGSHGGMPKGGSYIFLDDHPVILFTDQPINVRFKTLTQDENVGFNGSAD
jgi:hypothetical protein